MVFIQRLKITAFCETPGHWKMGPAQNLSFQSDGEALMAKAQGHEPRQENKSPICSTKELVTLMDGEVR